jgi:PhnB protein
MTLQGADTPGSMEYHPGTNGSIAVSGDNEAELRGYFQKLSVGGKIGMPMEKAPWGDTFGMCTDKFGINWMVDVLAKKP